MTVPLVFNGALTPPPSIVGMEKRFPRVSPTPFHLGIVHFLTSEGQCMRVEMIARYNGGGQGTGSKSLR